MSEYKGEKEFGEDFCLACHLTDIFANAVEGGAEPVDLFYEMVSDLVEDFDDAIDEISRDSFDAGFEAGAKLVQEQVNGLVQAIEDTSESEKCDCDGCTDGIDVDEFTEEDFACEDCGEPDCRCVD